jgi:hypothetical protein
MSGNFPEIFEVSENFQTYFVKDFSTGFFHVFPRGFFPICVSSWTALALEEMRGLMPVIIVF